MKSPVKFALFLSLVFYTPVLGQEQPSEEAQASDQAAPSSTATEALPAEEENAQITTTAASEEPKAAEPPASEPEELPWRNSFFGWTQGITANTFFKDSQLTYDPNYYWSFFLQPRWYLENKTFLVLTQGLSVELTDSNLDVYQREPQLSDTTLELRHIESLEGFNFIFAGRIALPLSKWSQAAQRYLQAGVGLTATRTFTDLAGLTLAANFGYRHWFSGSNVALTNASFPQQLAIPGNAADPASTSPRQAGGLSTSNDTIVYGLTLNIAPIEHFTLTTQFQMIHLLGQGLSTAYVDVNGSQVAIADMSPTHWRNFTSFSLQGAYDVVQWLNLALGYSSAAFFTSAYNDDGSLRNPFWNPDSVFYLSATVTLDGLYHDLAGGDKQELSPEEQQRRRQGLANNRLGASTGSL